MKKLIFVFVGLVLMLSKVQAQSNTVGVNVGFSMIGWIFNQDNGDYAISTKSTPAFQATFDHQLVNSMFSVGGAVSVQKFQLHLTTDNLFAAYPEDFTNDFYRVNLAVRGLVHYGVSDKIDMYSGFRLGLTYWNITTTSTNSSYKPEDELNLNHTVLPAPQLILFGLRGYFWNNFGANAELCFGSPHYFSLGLNYRF